MMLVALVIPFVRFAEAAVLEPGFSESTFINNSGLNQVTGIAWAPDGSNRLFAITKGGSVRIIQYQISGSSVSGVLVPEPFATEQVITSSECGLIGMCFDPDFVNNGYVYLFATNSSSEQRIIRHTASGNISVDRMVLVSGLPTRGANHDGGAIGIGPDGKLYWAVGDLGNGTGVNANLTSLAAKAGRADRFTGAPLDDNPHYDGPGSNNDYIWAKGLRNPFTAIFHPWTGDFWVNVVGTDYEQIFRIGAGDHAGYNQYENNQPAGFLQPVISYRTNGTVMRTIPSNGAVRSGGIVTFTTTEPHGFRQGGTVNVAGIDNTSFNGQFSIASVPSPTTFTVAQAGANATSGNGSVTTLNIGGCVTGGYFYDSTAFPSEYHRNFFFGDYNSHRVERVVLEEDDRTIKSVSHFLTGNTNQVDIATGPDGALYLASVSNNQIKRIATTSMSQNVLVYPTAFQMTEGGDAMFTVRLASQPEGNTQVTITKKSGDPDIQLVTSGTLTFNAANWNQLQIARLKAAPDADSTNDTAVFQVALSESIKYDVTVRAIDGNYTSLVLSTGNVTVVEGGTNSFQVHLDRAPESSVTVSVSKTSGSSDVTIVSGTSLTFHPDHYDVPQTIVVAAAEDAGTSDESAVLTLTLAGSPTRNVNVFVTDNDQTAPVITTSAVTTAIEGNPYLYDVDAIGQATITYSLDANPSGMIIDSATGLIEWTPETAGSYNVTVRASNGVSPDAVQNFQILVSADAAPSAVLTRPVQGEVLSGTNAEFFGNGVDDAGTIKAEFFVDDVLVYTDENTGGHYHFGGAHLLFDTTQYPNGEHTLRMMVTDTSGQTGSAEVNVIFSNGFVGWLAEHFTPEERLDPEISGGTSDPDGDGIVNLFEYGSGGDPREADSTRAPKAGTANVSGSEYLTLAFIRSKEVTEITFTVEATSDLSGSWSPIDPEANQVNYFDDVPEFGLATIVVRDTQPIGGEPRFLRLRVTEE
jgi:glucose/arabinose dehydrogenase